jgi:hypothetical protein
MNRNKNLLSALLPILISVPSAVFAQSNIPLNNKQLAGPPAEFEFMQKAQPEQSAITSKTALLPVSLSETKAGNWIWESKLPVDSGDFSFMVFANGSTNWKIQLRNPITNQVHFAEELATEQVTSKFGMEQNTYPGEKYTFNNLDLGNWDISIKTDGEPEQFEGYVLLSNKSQYQLRSYKTNLDQIVGHNIHFVTQATTNENTLEVLKSVNPLSEANMLVTSPNGNKFKVAMYDDGMHGDNKANDGLFGGDFIANESGGYKIQVSANGTNPNGTSFLRTSEHYIPVIEQTITLDSNKAMSTALNDSRLNISFDVQNHQKSLENRYRIVAEVWGTSKDKTAEMQPVSWISTITDVNKNQLNIELDARWIAMSDTQAPFELRNLRIEDSNYFIPLISQDAFELNVPTTPKKATIKFDGNIDQEMMMGVRPNLKSVNKGTGSKLLLVHGYCSGNAWGSVQSQFSNSAVFQDFNQNRSHDQFANLIKNFGNQYNSFGIVAHSQGGAASLHLYTYYWSGLDNATGSRLIQSVGTPYQGTPLAGNLAALGDIFGAGCGYNANLTTSGAASWLSGIPTWARNQVSYYTTSFATKWWRYDYCSIATDLFLSDPEDGVIEKSRGQLSGGSNKGHKTGWCHTTDMRDPGQTTDSSRNSTMSAYAKR